MANTATEARTNTGQLIEVPWLQAITTPRKKGRTPRPVGPRRMRVSHEAKLFLNDIVCCIFTFAFESDMNGDHTHGQEVDFNIIKSRLQHSLFQLLRAEEASY